MRHVGLGSASLVEVVDVRGSDGRSERFGVEGFDQGVVLKKGTGDPLDGN